MFWRQRVPGPWRGSEDLLHGGFSAIKRRSLVFTAMASFFSFPAFKLSTVKVLKDTAAVCEELAMVAKSLDVDACTKYPVAEDVYSAVQLMVTLVTKLE